MKLIKGTPPPMAPRTLDRIALALRAYNRPHDLARDPGRRQRAAAAGMAAVARSGGVAQRRGAPSTLAAYYTEPAQIIGPSIGLENVDPIAGVSAHGAGTRPRLPGTKARSVVPPRLNPPPPILLGGDA